jgi:hypothetical protein
MDLNSIARTERNSLSFRQLVQPGCQKTFSVVSLCIASLSLDEPVTPAWVVRQLSHRTKHWHHIQPGIGITSSQAWVSDS